VCRRAPARSISLSSRITRSSPSSSSSSHSSWSIDEDDTVTLFLLSQHEIGILFLLLNEGSLHTYYIHTYMCNRMKLLSRCSCSFHPLIRRRTRRPGVGVFATVLLLLFLFSRNSCSFPTNTHRTTATATAAARRIRLIHPTLLASVPVSSEAIPADSIIISRPSADGAKKKGNADIVSNDDDDQQQQQETKDPSNEEEEEEGDCLHFMSWQDVLLSVCWKVKRESMRLERPIRRLERR
jgi:hypothetical protein